MAKFSLSNPAPPAVDPEALEAFAAGARDRQTAADLAPPWAAFDPRDKPRYNVAIRLNDYELTMLRYLAEVRDTSQHKLLHRQLIPILKQLAEDAFAAQVNATPSNST